MPSKALLHVAKMINETHESAAIGVTFTPPKIDLAKLRDWNNNGVVGKLTGGVAELCRARTLRR